MTTRTLILDDVKQDATPLEIAKERHAKRMRRAHMTDAQREADDADPCDSAAARERMIARNTGKP